MNVNSQIATQSVSLCAGGASFFIGLDPTSFTVTAIAATTLAALGYDIRRNCPRGTFRGAQKQVLDTLGQLGYSDDERLEALQILEGKTENTLTVEELAALATEDNIPHAAAAKVMTTLPTKNKLAGAVTLAEQMLEHAMHAFLQQVKPQLAQEVILQSIKYLSRIEGQLDEMTALMRETTQQHQNAIETKDKLITRLEKGEAQLEAEITQLSQQIEGLEAKLRKPEKALEEALATIESLRAKLERESNELHPEMVQRAEAALERFDYNEAREIFLELRAREQLGVERAARAEFALGEIAEQEVRWRDAVEHYKRSSELNLKFEYVCQATRLSAFLGDLKNATYWADKLSAFLSQSKTDQSLQLANAFSLIGDVKRENEDLSSAIEYQKKGIDILKSLKLDKDGHFVSNLQNLALAYKSNGDSTEALEVYIAAIEIAEEAGLTADISTSRLYSNYAMLIAGHQNLQNTNTVRDAEEKLFAALENVNNKIGSKNTEYAYFLGRLGQFYYNLADFKRSEKTLVQAVRLFDNLGNQESSILYASTLNDLANCYGALGTPQTGVPILEKAIEISIRARGSHHSETKRYVRNLEVLKSTI